MKPPMKPGQQRRRYIKPRSEKMQAIYAGDGDHEGRRDLVARLLAERPWCEACEVLDRPGVKIALRSQDVHEILPRSAGGSLTDPANLRCVCRPCHLYLHAHPKRAMELGLKKSRYGSVER